MVLVFLAKDSSARFSGDVAKLRWSIRSAGHQPMDGHPVALVSAKNSRPSPKKLQSKLAGG